MAESEKSITWIVTAVMVVIALFGWGFLAGSYAGATSPAEITDVDIRVPRRPSVVAVGIAAGIKFVVTSFEQLPNLPSVISWHLSNRLWLPAAIIILEILTFLGGISLKAVENKLSQPYRKRL